MHDLLARLEAHVGEYDSRYDEQIARAIGWDQDDAGEWHQVGNFFGDGLRRTAYAVELPPFTRSLDAALTLVPPLHWWQIESGGHAIVGRPPTPTFALPQYRAFARTPALALCIAALRARMAAQEASHE